jgi:trk system potassium uptake protein TrkA
MKTQALVIGLGQFGMSLARALSERGVEVMAVDRSESRVQLASGFAAQAAAFDATDEESLVQAGPAERDVCVVAIGLESREGAIIVTALLRQMGARRVVARAADDLMERILYLVGAHEVVNPEKAFGGRLADRLVYAGLLDEVMLGDDLVITELRPPSSMVGRTLVELALPRRFDVTVVGIRRTVDGRGRLVMPNPSEPLGEDDILVVVSEKGKAKLILEHGR